MMAARTLAVATAILAGTAAAALAAPLSASGSIAAPEHLEPQAAPTSLSPPPRGDAAPARGVASPAHGSPVPAHGSPAPTHSPGPGEHHLGPGRHAHPPFFHHRPRLRVDTELSPRQVVDLFCALDAEGARLSDNGLHREISRLAAWGPEPGWDETTAIRSFSVGDAESFGDFAHVEVRFSVIGTVTPDHLEPMSPDQTVEFHLERRGKIWWIESPLYEPHVFRSELVHKLTVATTPPALLKALADAR